MPPLLVCIVFFAVAVPICIAVAVAQRATFEERFPPITDAEFLALCTPGTNPGVALKVRRLVAEYFAVAYERVHPSMTFIEDIGAD